MGRGDLSDAEWDLIGPLLPPERGRWARPSGDNRRFLNGMLHVLRVGCPWRDMHERYGMMGEVLLLCYAALRNKTEFYVAWVLSTIVTVFSYKGFLVDGTITPQQIGAYVNLAILLLLSRELLLAPGQAEKAAQTVITA